MSIRKKGKNARKFEKNPNIRKLFGIAEPIAVRIMVIGKEAENMSKRGENIYKRKDGRWEGRYIKGRTQGGKARYGYIYAKTYREVKAKLNQLPEKPLPAENVDSQDGADATSVKEMAELWFTSVCPQIKESTSVKYRNILNAYVLPKLGSVLLRDMTRECIEAYCNRLLLDGGARGSGLSAKTVSDVLAVLRSILRFAEENGKTPPCDGRSVQIKKNSKEMRVFSKAEQELLCQKLYGDLSAPNVGILVCLFTGLRVGEICALRWEDVSLREKTIHVHQTMQRIQTAGDDSAKTKVIITAPKSACSIRTIPIPDEIADVIARFGQSPRGYFLTGCENKFIEPRTMQNHFKRLLDECAIQTANYHALRHTFATRCVELGFDVKSLSEILGHASVNITMNRYVHPSLELKRENMQRLSSLIAVR